MSSQSPVPLDSLPSGSVGQAAFVAALDEVWVTVQHLLGYLLWALMVCLAASAGCWCCGYAARETWLRMRPTPPHRGAPGRSGQGRDRRGGTAGEDTIADLAAAVATAGDGTTAIDLTVAQEAAEGIREIEAYLARVA